MMNLAAAAKYVTAIGVIGGGALALDQLHVPQAEFDKYLESQQTRYVLELKSQIRQVKISLKEHPTDPYLNEHLAELLDALCELRPEDKLCKD